MKRATFMVDVYSIRVHLLWDVNSRQISKFVRDNVDSRYRYAGRFAGVCIVFRGGDTATIGLRSWRGSARDTAVLAHEVFHATSWIMRDSGVKLCAATEENFAYLHESIMVRCLKKLK